ncbi:EF-hand and coiled-coil domain-containing protein 1 isoform X1 [Gadus macrocephalus]|uniref:EF-hand and coiled-coil domain-containing protein 1 isoform X1 n=1 Tax=Gadus macrocephalus TaxID=80720 RepID=UPI0028CB4872|nr:EF-hand and coiled-coil domain-containing protein 1 isoform X1 [Gadus macrocephalus]
MEKIDVNDPYGRPARRTQWIVSTLAFHYGLDRGVENEIIVLATGLDQYLQEIFHHMDYQGSGKVHAEDFHVLCEVLGLNKDSDSESECGEEEVSENLPGELTFRQFHALLCGYFSTKAGCQYENGRLLVGKDSEHIETQIRLRSPLRRRERLLSVSGGSSSGTASPSPEEGGHRRGRHASSCRLGSCTRECYEEIVALEEAEDRIAKIEEENASLRELVEDMRAALQSSDARCLALQVGLWKSHGRHKPEEGCFIALQHQHQHHHQAAQRSLCDAADTNNPPSTTSPDQADLSSLQSLIREVEELRSSTDLRMEEVVLCNQRLEREVNSSREALAALEESNRTLKREQAGTRRRMEEARQAVLTGMGKVKQLEEKAGNVPVLERRVLRLEAELCYYRSEVSKLQLPIGGPDPGPQEGVGSRAGPPSGTDPQHDDRCSPTGWDDLNPDKAEEQMFRSVEGQAASDEEEDKWTGEQQRQVDEVRRILSRLSCCEESRCDDRAFRKLMSTFGGGGGGGGSSRGEEGRSAAVELLQKVTRLHKQLELRESRAEMDMDQMKDSLVQELQQKAEETEQLQVELQMLETERVRLSLVEEKLLDVLQLLQHLRDLNVSRRSLGKILLSTLESCSDPQHGKAHILEVLNALHHELTACEVLSSAGSLERTPSQRSLEGLVISC